MNFNVFWEALEGPRVTQNASKNDAKNQLKKRWKIRDAGHAAHAGFFGWGRGVPSKKPCGKQAKDREAGPRAPGNQ